MGRADRPFSRKGKDRPLEDSKRNALGGIGAGKAAGPLKGALRVAGIYSAAGAVWILFSDGALNLLTHDQALIQSVSIAKGLVWVAATAILLFMLVRQALKGEIAYSRKLDESYAELQANYGLLDAGRKSLKQSEEQYKRLFNEMLYGYCVFEVVLGKAGKPEGIRALHANPAFMAITGAGKGEQPDEGLFRLLQGERKFWLDGFEGVEASGRTMHFQVYSESGNKYVDLTAFRPAPGRFAVILNDITQQKLTERALDAESEELRVTLNSIGDGVIAADAEGRVKMMNRVAEEFTGWKQAEAEGLPVSQVLELLGGRSGTDFASMMHKMLGCGQASAFKGEVRIKSRDGRERVVSGNAAPMKAANGNRTGFVTVFRDVTERRKREAEILYLSYHDLLTGLYNRAFFDEELKRLDTPRQLPLSIIMGDANNLKLVNDVFGHREGDDLLRAAARAIRESCRAEDIVSRWGGDEFVVLLPKTDTERAKVICGRITEKCGEIRTEQRKLNPSISLGYDTKESPETEVGHVIKAAEDMMYKNKLTDSRSAHNEFLAAMMDRMSEGNLETNAHTARISELCERVGREMGLAENELADLKTLSLLHDIGKAAVDASILSKPGKLTQEEWEEVKRHSGIGYRISRSAPELINVADYILGHHERWDGTGYPQGLKGEKIPLAARIVAVVDAYDVMTRGRPYKPAVSREEALREICRNAGTQFDPEVVNAFASVIDSLTDQLDEEICCQSNING
jgi:diguanylate cyclase (GGDEF)-like protein/PAS domain S-box-containing protein